MPTRDNVELHQVEELATLLDTTTESGLFPASDAPTGASAELATTARRLIAASHPRHLSPSFADRLEQNLMVMASLDIPIGWSPRSFPTNHDRFPANASSTAASPSRRRGLIEVLTFSALIALVFSQAMGYGRNVAFWQDATPVATPMEPTSGLLRVDAGRSGAYTDPGPSGVPVLRWIARDPAPYTFAMQPIAQDGSFYVAAPPAGEVRRYAIDGSFAPRVGLTSTLTYAVDRDTVYVASGFGDAGTLSSHGDGFMTERWHVDSGVTAGALALDGDRLFMVDTLGDLRAFDADDGAALWRVDLEVGRLDTVFLAPDFVSSDPSPAVADGAVVVATPGGGVRSFTATDGSVRWQIDLPEEIVGSPTIVDGTIYIAARGTGFNGTPGTGHVYALDAGTGAERWSVASPAWTNPPSMANGIQPLELMVLTVDDAHVYLNGDGEAGDTVTALAADSGEIAWTHRFDAAAGAAPVVSGDTLYLTRPDGGVYGLDAATGEQRWRLDAGTPNLLSPAIVGDLLVVAESNGTVIGLGASPDAPPVGGTPVPTDDVSGLPPCEPPRLQPDPLPTGQPSTRLDVLVQPSGRGEPAALRADLPISPIAGADALAGILDTFRGMYACDRPGREREFGGYFSDDYYRRIAIAYPEMDLLAEPSVVRPPYRYDLVSVVQLPPPVLLSDGRVALLFWDDQFREGQLTVFVQQDDAWLIDEIVRVTDNPDQPTS